MCSNVRGEGGRRIRSWEAGLGGNRGRVATGWAWEGKGACGLRDRAGGAVDGIGVWVLQNPLEDASDHQCCCSCTTESTSKALQRSVYGV